MIRERVVDGEPAIDVDTEEEFDQALSSGAWVIASPTADVASWHPCDEDNTDALEDVLAAADQDPTRDEASDPPGWLIRRLWAWANDGIARSAEQWFRRHNPKAPDRGGARKSQATKPKAWLEDTRARWAQQANRALARAGRPEQIHAGSLAQQLTEAEHRGDADEIARLAHREPGVHLGPHNLRAGRARGVVGAGGRGRLGRGP